MLPTYETIFFETVSKEYEIVCREVYETFTAGNSGGARDQTFPRYIYHGKYPARLRQKEERNRPCKVVKS